MITVSTRKGFLQLLNPYLPKDCTAVEIGVFRGEFSELIADILGPYKLYLIDPFIVAGKKYGNGLNTAYSTESDYEAVWQRFEMRFKPIIIKKFSYDAVVDFIDRTKDFIYIDASHLYEDVKRDLKDWFPKLKQGGIIAGHDYIENDNFGVIQAVDEFCLENDLEIFLLNENGGDWAIIK